MNSRNTISFSFFFDQVKLSHQQHWFILAVMAVITIAGYQCGINLFDMGSLFLLAMGGTYAFTLAYHSIEKSSAPLDKRSRRLKRVATWQALLDLLFITAVVHFTGGPISPVPVMYIISIGVISTFFPLRELISLNLIAVLLYGCLMQSYQMDLISPVAITLPSGIIITKILISYLQIFYICAMLINGTLIAVHTKKTQSDWQAVDSQNTYLDRLHGLTKLGLESIDLTELYKTLATEIKLVLGADSIYITDWDKEPQPIHLEKLMGDRKASGFASLASSKYEMTMTQSVWWTGKPLVAEDVFCSPYLSYKSAQDYPAKSLLGLPLVGLPNRRFLGALLVAYNTPHSFSPAEVNRAQQVADVAALLISRTRLYDETQRRASLLEQMSDEVSRLTSDLRQTTLLPAIVESARNLLKAERAALHMYEKSSRKMRCEFSVGLSSNYLEHMSNHFDESPEGLVLHNQNYVLIPDVQRDSRTSPIQGLIAQEKFLAYAVFALTAFDGSLGALSLYWDQPHAISSEEVAVGRLFAERAGVLVRNVRLYEQISVESLTDVLTCLPNRRFIDQRLVEESQRSDRYGHPYSLLMIDLDGFKSINDCFGHPIGDSVLQQVAEALQRVLRSTDILTRYGGDEFAVILPETAHNDAIIVAEKLKMALASTKLHLPHNTQRYISACMGIAVYPQDAANCDDLIRVADKRMYDAKRKGDGGVVSGS
jgi:diguanylate cyclase (GGDEF)-like protein